MDLNQQSYKRFITTSAALVLILSVSVIFGWFMDIRLLTSVAPGMPTMKFNTALGFLLGSSALLAKELPQLKSNRFLGAIITFALLVLSVLTLFQELFHLDLGIDQLLFTDHESIGNGHEHPGRMSPSTAICFLFLAVGLLLNSIKGKSMRVLSQWHLHVITLISSLAILGYIFAVPTFYKLSFISSMALHTAISFLLLSIAASFLQPQIGITGLFTGRMMGNIMARGLFTRITITVLILTYLRILAHRYQIMSDEFGTALLSIAFIIAGLILIWFASRAVNKTERKQKDAENSLARIKMFLDSTPDSIIIINSDGHITLTNNQTGNVFGYDMHELNGSSLENLIPNRFRNDYKNHIQNFKGAQPGDDNDFLTEITGLKKDGSEFPAEMSLHTIILPDGKYISVSFRDITPRKKAEALLDNVSERFKIAMQSSRIGIWDLNLTKGEAEWNNIMFELYGRSKKEGSNPDEIWEASIHPNDKLRVKTELKGSIQKKSNFDSQFRIVWPDNSVHFIRAKATIYKNTKGVATRVLGTNWDITEQKNVETALRISNERNLIFVEQAPSAIAMFDTEMRYLAASQKWIEDYELKGVAIIGKSHYEIFPEIGEDWKNIHRECLAGAINTQDEASFEREDGTTQWISWDVRPWYVSEGEIGGLIMNTANITQFKETVLERLKIEKILEKSNEAARIGTWEVNLQTNRVAWSDITCEIHEVSHGYEPELANAINFYKEGESRDKTNIAVAEAIANGTPWDLELELVTANKNTIWVRAIGQTEFENGQCKRLFGIFQDIDKVKNYEASLSKLNEELKAILNSGYVSIIGTDTNGLITHFNKGAERLLQYSADEIIGHHTPALIHVEEEIIERGKELSEQFQRPIQGFDAFVEMARQGLYEAREWTYVRKDGSTFPVQLVVNSMKNDANEITGFLGTAVDISEIKHAQGEINALLEITTDQNERLKNFAHIVSHNLRSHSGNIGMLLDLFSDAHPEMIQDEIVSLFRVASDNLKETIAHLNQVALINTTVEENLTPINLYTAIEFAINNVRMLAKESSVEIENLVNQETTIKGITAYTDSILLNFITNGIKYSEPKRKSFIRLSDGFDDEYVILSIQDNGKGIDLQRHGAKLFGMYKTFHGNEDARGIGLFITKNQIDAIGGKIEVDSTLDKGTTFNIYFKK